MRSQCPFCSAAPSDEHLTAQDAMFELPGDHRYVRCGKCASWWMPAPPTDLAALYPPSYEAHVDSLAVHESRFVSVGSLARAARSAVLLSGGPLPQRIRRPRWAPWLRRAGITLRSSICDLGAGNGALVAELQRDGFRNAIGFDPYIGHDRKRNDRVLVARRAFEEIEGSYDVVMMHHVLEHLPDPEAAVAKANSLLRPGGVLVVAVPLSDSWAFTTYKEFWAHLDAPRHLQLPTRHGIMHLAARHGFDALGVHFDSGDYSVTRSRAIEGGRRDGGGWQQPRDPVIDRWAAHVNACAVGDSAVFVFRRSNAPVQEP